jgi:hypothetical protein
MKYLRNALFGLGLGLVGTGSALAGSAVDGGLQGAQRPRLEGRRLDGAERLRAEAHRGRKGEHGARAMSPEALKARVAKRFERLDADGDGALTREELAKARAEREGKRGKKGKARLHRRGGGDPAARVAKMEARFLAADTDGDGRLSREEMFTAAEARRAAHAEKGEAGCAHGKGRHARGGKKGGGAAAR